ncbi:unnamed protein product, partial [Pylaiella littoralis]
GLLRRGVEERGRAASRSRRGVRVTQARRARIEARTRARHGGSSSN